MKVVVVGGGSTYTPELIEGFARRSYGFSVDDLVLLDVDAERLGIVGGLARRMLERAGWGEDESRSRPCGVASQTRPRWSSRNEPITFAGNPFATV